MVLQLIWQFLIWSSQCLEAADGILPFWAAVGFLVCLLLVFPLRQLLEAKCKGTMVLFLSILGTATWVGWLISSLAPYWEAIGSRQWLWRKIILFWGCAHWPTGRCPVPSGYPYVHACMSSINWTKSVIATKKDVKLGRMCNGEIQGELEGK